jgi:hypothetical protein
MKFRLLFSGLLLTAALHAGAQMQYVETFESASNEDRRFTYGSPGEFVDETGGNSGKFLHAPDLDTFAPQPGTLWGEDSPFVGDYRARGVTSVGVDLQLFHVDFSAEERPLSLMLVSDNGTLDDFEDDWAAYFIGNQNIPLEGEGWRSYDFAIPSQSSTLPSGWRTRPLGSTSPAEPSWNDLISNVSQLRFFYGEPENFYIFQVWDVGMDNVRITAVPLPPSVVPMFLGLTLVGAQCALARRRSKQSS